MQSIFVNRNTITFTCHLLAYTFDKYKMVCKSIIFFFTLPPLKNYFLVIDMLAFIRHDIMSYYMHVNMQTDLCRIPSPFL